MTNRFDGTVSRIDPDSGEVVEIPVGLDPRGIAIGFGSVWVGAGGVEHGRADRPASERGDAADQCRQRTGVVGSERGAAWVVNTLDDTVSRINPDTNSVADTVAVGDGPSEIAVVGEVVWVANEADGTLSRIEPGQSSASSMVIESAPQGMAPVGTRSVGHRS